MGSLKKRRKDSFLTLISNTYLFIIHPANNIFYANKGCNDILFDNIILSGEFKFDTLQDTYIIIIYVYMSINKRFTTTLFDLICCNASLHAILPARSAVDQRFLGLYMILGGSPAPIRFPRL